MDRRIYRPYQKNMDAYASGVRNPILFVEMRLGKTLVTTRRVAGYGRGMNNLIAAPYSAFPAWRKEMQAEGIQWTELTGTGVERRQRLGDLSGWVLTNKEVWKTAPGIKDLRWHNRILDESTFVKNPFAKVTQFYNDPSWGNLLHDWRLTGTPNPESDLDFYSQAPWIWPQPDYHRWRGYWFVPFGKEWRVKPRLSKEFHKILAANCFFLSRRDAGIGGTKVYQTRLVKMPPELRAIYKRLAKEFVLQIPEGTQWETEFAGVTYSWLRRLCGGALPDPDGLIRGWWDGKVKELSHLLHGEMAREQVLVWAHFKEEIERIHTHLLSSKRGRPAFIHGGIPPARRDQIIEDFRKGKYKWLIAQPVCLRYSTDLSFLDTEIYFSSPEGFETRFQSEDRLITGDKSTPALVVDLCTEDTVEEVIQSSLIRKESRAEMVRKVVQALQQEARK